MNYGYMGLAQPLDTKWSDGRNVIVFPSGEVIDKSNNRTIREAETSSIEPVSNNKLDNTQIILFGMFILGVIAIVAIAKK
jgi:hypothetical protein